ncbi:MAG: hypothetical protein KGO96_00595 [Elusimicrobia bacterium]|nr:hypothetical protein [Elusimicrobiota bacterium]MDE2424392.1 hypothetical protein [Elusimicrobiota bacterium]
MPAYLSLSPNINDFTRFADGGPDDNWYVGFDNAWIVKLPSAPAGDFSRAFIGAKLGRAKAIQDPNKPWLRERIKGRIYMAISPSPSFSAEQSFFLTDLKDIPLESYPDSFAEGVGSSEWFWTEVPLSLINFDRPNYLIIWSPSKFLVSDSSAPILAGLSNAEQSGQATAWNNHSITGVPPRSPDGALETPLNNVSPALAIKLVPNAVSEVSVGDFSLQRFDASAVGRFSVASTDLDEAWIESSRDRLNWTRATPYRRRQPFLFTLDAARLAPGTFWRAAARDSLGTVGYSDIVAIPYGSP